MAAARARSVKKTSFLGIGRAPGAAYIMAVGRLGVQASACSVREIREIRGKKTPRISQSTPNLEHARDRGSGASGGGTKGHLVFFVFLVLVLVLGLGLPFVFVALVLRLVAAFFFVPRAGADLPAG